MLLIVIFVDPAFVWFIIICLVLSILSRILFCFLHSCMLSRVCWVLSPLKLLNIQKVRRASAYLISSAVVGRYSFISVIKRRNKAWSRTLHCVTPAITLNHSECLLLHFTLCFLPLGLWAIYDVSNDGSILSIFFRRIIWSTRSNYFAK